MSNSYDDVMARRSDIMRRALALDYDSFQHGDLIFDYDALMSSTGYSLDDVARIQAETKVGDTPLYELHRLTEAVREIAGPGKGARILLKDEAANASGSFKARRASLSAHEAQAKGFAGIVTATSGNYGAGKHHNSQLSFARSRGIEVRRGDPAGNVPGKAIVIPERLDQVSVHPLDLDKLRHSYLRHASQIVAPEQWGDAELEFLAAETNTTTDDVRLIGTELVTRTKGA